MAHKPTTQSIIQKLYHTIYKIQNQFDSIDLSDNAIVRLEGFPRLPRLKVLYLNNNRVAKVARNLHGELG